MEVKHHVLIVEDETIVALDLKSRLEALGYTVPATFTTGEDAIENVGRFKPDLVLMDIELAGTLDGIQTAERIRKSHGIPVIYLTACVDDRTIQRAKITEPFGYIVKPFEDQELHSHIEIAIYKNKNESKLRESEERYSLAAQGTNDGLWDWTLDSNTIYLSPTWECLLGYSPDELDNDIQTVIAKIHPADRRRIRKEFVSFLRDGQMNFQSEYRMLHADGAYRWMMTRGMALRNRDGRVYRMAGSQSDITERKLRDPLTGLPNRALFMDRLERAMERFQNKKKRPFAVVAIQTDSFESIKETFGYQKSDEILQRFIRRIIKNVSENDTVVSLGDGKFAILLEDLGNVSKAASIAAAVQSSLVQRVELEEESIYPVVSVGIAHGLQDYRLAEDVLNDAQTALNWAAKSGNGRFEVFDSVMRSEVREKIKLENDLRKAAENHEFGLHYQPIISIREGKIKGFEALLRWNHTEAGLIPPSKFVPVLEETGLIVELERWVLHEACIQLLHWQHLFRNSGLELSVNFSSQQYLQKDLVSFVNRTIRETGVRADTLKLEITESTFLQDSDIVRHVLTGIRALGVHLHLDDFGTGYSSLSYLRNFPISVLKIDRSFIQHMDSSQESQQIVKAIANLGQNLQMKVTAEGIESEEQLMALKSLDCDYGQGFLFSKPLAPALIEELVGNAESRSLSEQFKISLTQKVSDLKRASLGSELFDL